MTDTEKLVAHLRAEALVWREQVGEMPLFDRAADALEAEHAEVVRLRSALHYSELGRANDNARKVQELARERDRLRGIIEEALDEWASGEDRGAGLAINMRNILARDER